MGVVGMGVIGVVLVLSGIAGFFLSLFYLIIPSSHPLVLEKLKKYNLTEERFNELYHTWQGRYVKPKRFLRVMSGGNGYKGFRKQSGERAKDISLEDFIGQIIPKLPHKKPRELFLTTVENIWNRWDDQYLLDFCIGGGWTPPHERPTQITPVPYNLLTIEPRYSGEDQIFEFEHDCNFFGKFLKNKELAYTFDAVYRCCFNLILSSDDNITPNQMEHFWTALQPIKHPVTLEIIGNGTAHTVVFQLLCHTDDKTRIANQLSSLFPHSTINPNGDDEDFLTSQLGETAPTRFLDDFDAHGVPFGLGNHYLYPIRTWTSFDKTDPLGSFIDLLSDLQPDEGAVIQTLVAPLKTWEAHFGLLNQTIEQGYDIYGFKDCPLPRKRRLPLFAVCFRSMIFRKKKKAIPQEDLHVFSDSLEKTLQMFQLTDSNSISSKPTALLQAKAKGDAVREVQISEPKPTNEGMRRVIRSLFIPQRYVDIERHLLDRELVSVLTRNTYRHGFILNTQELASLCHFPHPALQHPKLLRQDSTMVKAPDHITKGDGLLIGINEVFGQSQEVYVPEDFRFRHLYVVGKTGTGKTSFLYNMIKHDIDAGKGVGLIDPHGDLVETVLTAIPEHRIDDVILFDPSDYEHPIGFNMFQVNTAQERRQMRTDILVSIRRLFEDAAWGDNIDQLFRTSIATLLADTTQIHTLIDIRRLIGDEVFRSEVLGRIDDDFLQEFWREDFPNFTRLTTSAVRRRLGSVLSEPEVRNVLSQRETSFNFKEMMDTHKIFLAKLSRGTLGEDISSLFGGLLVSKIQLTAMARDAQPEHERVPFYLYVDEFQNFVNESFGVILSEARKYKLSLTMAHQFTAQLTREVYNAVFGNVGTLIAFSTGVDDATALEKQLGKFSREDIINLENFHTITRIGRARDAFSMSTIPPVDGDPAIRERVKEASREKYSRRVEETPPKQEPPPREPVPATEAPPEPQEPPELPDDKFFEETDEEPTIKDKEDNFFE